MKELRNFYRDKAPPTLVFCNALLQNINHYPLMVALRNYWMVLDHTVSQNESQAFTNFVLFNKLIKTSLHLTAKIHQ